jgi:hypothetical protein
MTDDEQQIAMELVSAFDGTSVHNWDLYAAASANGMIVTEPGGKRYSLTITVRLIEPSQRQSEEPKE